MTVDDRTHDGSGDGERQDEVVRIEWTEFGEPSSGIVEAVARATDERPTDLPPLHNAVETDALNVLLTDDQRSSQSSFRVTFSYARHRITATAGGQVVVRTDGR